MDVSVVIPCFHEPRWIQAIQSIESQQGVSIEAIVVDGSALPSSFPKWNFKIPVTFIHEKDSGVYDAMNKGITCAKGRWILILGANDQLASPTSLSQLPLDLNCDLILGEIENIHMDHILTPKRLKSKWSNAIFWKHTLHQQGMLYHRNCFTERHFQTDYKILGDYEFHLWLRQKKIKTFSSTSIISKCDGNGLSKQYTWKLYKEELKLKKANTNSLFFAIQIPWVILKFLTKKLF